jgi:hypothetical protein
VAAAQAGAVVVVVADVVGLVPVADVVRPVDRVAAVVRAVKAAAAAVRVAVDGAKGKAVIATVDAAMVEASSSRT